MHDQKKIKILILEDSPEDVDLMERQLRKDGVLFETECVDTRNEFTEALHRFRPDVVLSDHGLPQFNSAEALKICQREKIIAPFILVTGTVSEEFAVSCLRNGAHDYILKGSLSRLSSAIRRAIRESNLELMRREAGQTLKKQNEELIKANAELDHFVYSVSHNLRGPLASVMGLLNVATLEDRSQKLSMLHGMMKSSIEKLDMTLREIVDYSQNSRTEVKSEPINWRELIHSSFEKLNYLNVNEPVSKSINITGEFPFYSDRDRLAVIFNNLLSNSILFRAKYRELVVAIDIRLYREGVTIQIKDNGIGIEEAFLPRIFDMFYRGTDRSRGAGLGLYIVAEMVSKLNGRIEVSSVIGVESVFTLTLPSKIFENGFDH
jgi:signal transduction histidine kinase